MANTVAADIKELHDDLELARTLAAVASDVILPYFRNCQAEYKADGSEVTIADRKAEEAIRALLQQERSEHALAGEEFGGVIDPAAPATWVIDPIDGTTYFALGLPSFGTLISLVRYGEPVIGVVSFPVTGETLFAASGLGCWSITEGREAERVQVADPTPLAGAFCSAAGVHGTDVACDGDPALSAVVRAAGKFRFLGDCQQHALLCKGRIHLAIDTIMQPWDIAALTPCIREAGGIATDLRGNGSNIVSSGSLISACSPELLEEVLGRLWNPSPSQ